MNTYRVKRTPESNEFIDFLEKEIFHQKIDEIHQFVRGGASNNFLVVMGGTKRLVKLTNNYGLDGIERLSRICAALSENQLLIGARIITVNGKLYFQYRNKYGIVMEYCDGEPRPSYQMGKKHFQQVISQYTVFQQTKWQNKADLIPVYPMADQCQTHIAFLENALEKSGKLSGIKKGIYQKLCQTHLDFLKRMADTDLDWPDSDITVIHGDFHNNNVLFRKDKLLTFLDYEELGLGHPSEDLMRFILCLVQRLPIFINPYTYIEKWLDLCAAQFHFTTEEWIKALNSYYLQRADKAFQETDKFASTKQMIKMIKLRALINRYNAVLKRIYRLKNKSK